MIWEGVVITRNADGSPHITPLGFRRKDARVRLAPFSPSTTLDNLRRDERAVMNLTDDVRVIAGCLTGRREWPVVASEVIDGWRLRDCLAHLELRIEAQCPHAERPVFDCRIVHEDSHAPFSGFNRAQAAVVEAAILVSRLDWIAPEKVAAEMAYLDIAVSKTAGPRELTAWQWLRAAIAAHPRHQLRSERME